MPRASARARCSRCSTCAGPSRDPRLAARLARGLVRAAGRLSGDRAVRERRRRRSSSDAIRDVRALSFAVEVPPGLVGPAASAARLLCQQRAHLSDQRRARLRHADARARRRRRLAQAPHALLVAAARRHRRDSAGSAVLGALQTQQPVRAYQQTSVLEHGAVPPRSPTKRSSTRRSRRPRTRCSRWRRAGTACGTSSHATCATTRR